MVDIDWTARLDARGLEWYCGFVHPFPEDITQITEERLLAQPRCGRWHPTREAREACTHGADDGVEVIVPTDAVFSEDGVYRYLLMRSWDDGEGRILWIMLNPSVADAHTDDPTIARCVTFSKRWGYRSMFVCNLFAYRATDPTELKLARVPIVGPDNASHIEEQVKLADRVMVAWGANPFTHNPHRPDILTIARNAGKDLYCLGVTSKGAPKHPLYVPAKYRPTLWRAANE